MPFYFYKFFWLLAYPFIRLSKLWGPPPLTYNRLFIKQAQFSSYLLV